jgi:hypothetical protein
LAYTEFNPGSQTENFEDDTFNGGAFKDLPIQTKRGAEFPVSMNLKYAGLDALMYWAFGWEYPGVSPVDLTGGYYSHLWELDRNDRHNAAYRASGPDEQYAGQYTAGDLKNRAATMAIKRGTNDFRYKNAMCKKFTISGKAGEPLKFSADVIAYFEERGDYSNANWTFASPGSALSVMFHHLTVSIGPSGSLVAVGITDFDISVSIPLQATQDTVSGLYVMEPVFEGKYDIAASFTLSRFSADTYLAYKEALTPLCAKLVAASGSYGFEMFLPKLVIPDAPISGDNVANQKLTFNCASQTNALNPFATETAGHTIIQESPFFLVTKNQNATNEMRRE